MALEDVLSTTQDDVTPFLQRVLGRESLPATHGALDSIGAGLRYLRDLANPAPKYVQMPNKAPAATPAAAPAAAPVPVAPQRVALRAPVDAPAAAQPVEAAPVGALSDPDRYEPLMANGMQAGALPAEPAPATAATPRASLQQIYQDAIAKLPKDAKGDLNQEQKRRIETDFWMNMLARSSRPGAYALGALGESGLAANAEARAQEERNLTRATEALNRQRQEALTGATLADKDTDNALQARHLGVTEEHYKRLDQRDQDRLRLLKQQVDQGKWKAMPNVKSGTYVLYDQESGQTRDTGIKIDTKEKDARGVEERLIERFMTDAKFRKAVEEFKMIGKTEPGSVTESREFQAALELTKAGAGMGGNEDPASLLKRNLESVRAITRGSAPAQSLPDPVANAGRTMTDTATGQKLKSDGVKWIPVR